MAGAGEAVVLAALITAFEAEFGGLVEPGLEERLGALLADPRATYLLAGEPAVGFLALRVRDVHRSVRPEALVDDLYVAPEHRGRGHGRALLRAAIAAARAEGAGHLELTTSEGDHAALGLYRAEGLRETEESTPGSDRVVWFGLDL